MRERERGADTGGGDAGSMQGARERQRETETQARRQREKQAPCGEPDVGLDSGSPGSCPGPKAALNR